LKPPGTERLKPKLDTLLSASAFKFSLRRYSMADVAHAEVGRCRLTLSNPSRNRLELSA
jgi:hypothetical protein